MKKIFTILGLFALTLVSAQNLITNGGLETWTDPKTKPDGWFGMGSGAQETTIVHSGTKSAKLTGPASGNANLAYADVPATGNTVYSVSYWILDNDANTRGRHWIQFRDASNANIGVTNNPFQPSTYSTDNPNWVNITATATSPAGTAFLRFDYRVYAMNQTPGGAIYFDDLVLAQGVLATGEAEMIKNNVKISNTIVTDSFSLTVNGKASVKVLSLTGQQVDSKEINGTGTFSTTKLSAGMYFVQVEQDGKIVVKKIIKR